MKIVLVLDQYDNESNGATVSAARFAEHLRARGHEVRVVSTGSPAPGKYVVPYAHMGILNPIFKAQDLFLGTPDDAVLREAIEGADVVHTFLPWRLNIRAREIAQELGIPVLAAFHLQPENVTYNIHMKYLGFVSSLLYRWFRRRHYRHVDHIHCPTQFIADQLRAHRYKGMLHVISNGADEVFHPQTTERPAEWQDRFVIMMVGRLNPEKRQDLIIKAALKSKYRDRIQLVFPGRGPMLNYYKRLGAKLKHPPVFGYYKKEDLARLMNSCDLYVHAAEVEIEAISCIEAFSSGLVPVIANARMSATRQFALTEDNLFKSRSVKDLVKKIEYWIEHPEEKAQASARYTEYAKKFSVERSVEKMEMVYQNMLDEKAYREKHANDPDAHKIHMNTSASYAVDEKFRFVNRSFFFALGSKLFYLFCVPILSFITRVFFGLKIEGHRNFTRVKGGAVTVANHVHPLDAPMIAVTIFPRMAHMASLKTNFEIPFVRWLVRLLGGVPIPETPKALGAFMEAMIREVHRGRLVHFYPEASLWPWHDELRPFKNGAFRLAVESEAPVIPMVFKYREPSPLVKKLRKKPVVTLQIGKPVYPSAAVGNTKKERIEALRDVTHSEMEQMLHEAVKSCRRRTAGE